VGNSPMTTKGTVNPASEYSGRSNQGFPHLTPEPQESQYLTPRAMRAPHESNWSQI
jgi:hypothetical protein